MTTQAKLAFFALTILFVIGILIFNRPVESAKRYQYKVLSVSGATQLRTQSDVDQGRLKTIENMIEEQSAQGWEFYQADGFILYFRR